MGAVVDAYMNEVVDVQRKRQRDRLVELDRLYTEKETELRSRRTEVSRPWPSSLEPPTRAPSPSNRKLPWRHTPTPVATWRD